MGEAGSCVGGGAASWLRRSHGVRIPAVCGGRRRRVRHHPGTAEEGAGGAGLASWGAAWLWRWAEPNARTVIDRTHGLLPRTLGFRDYDASSSSLVPLALDCDS